MVASSRKGDPDGVLKATREISSAFYTQQLIRKPRVCAFRRVLARRCYLNERRGKRCCRGNELLKLAILPLSACRVLCTAGHVALNSRNFLDANSLKIASVSNRR